MANIKFINFSMPKKHYRTEVLISLSHTLSIQRVIRILVAAIKSVPEVLNTPEPDAIIAHFNETGVVWAARCWLADYSQDVMVTGKVHTQILHHLQISGIPLSYPKRDNLRTAKKREILRYPNVLDLLNHIEFFRL